MIGDSENNTLDVIKGKLQIILDRSFKERYRRKIDVYSDRLNFACPVCGDSHSDVRKKRGNLYLNSLSYHCYNCGEHMGINSLLHRFGEDLSNEDKIVVHEIQQNSKKFERKTSTSQSSMSFNLLEKAGVPKMIFFKQLGIISPYKNERVSTYLKSRMIPIQYWKYFAYDVKTDELYILNTTATDRVIGFQIRQLNPNSIKSRYISKRLTRLYSDVFNKDINHIVEVLLSREPLGEKYIQEEDGIENIVANLDRLSGIFNIMNINLNQPITIMEGPIDSLSIPNSIALQGASKQLDGFFDNIENVRFVYDNDKTGWDAALKKLKTHKKVFLWKQYLNGLKTDKKIKDLNDLQKTNLFDLNRIEECFSDDEFDAMFI